LSAITKQGKCIENLPVFNETQNESLIERGDNGGDVREMTPSL